MTTKTEKGLICVDIGGTFTDCFVHFQDKIVFTKTPTTAYNLSVGFMRSVKDAASSLGLSPQELLSTVEAHVYKSSTHCLGVIPPNSF
jgi:N-methylhydantoinase A